MTSFPTSGSMTLITSIPRTNFLKRNLPKEKKKSDKTPNSSGIASKLLPLLEHWNFKPENSFSLVFRLYRQQFLERSNKKGLIVSDHLALAGTAHTF